MIFKKIFATQLKGLRYSKGLTQTQLGNIVGVQKTSISMMEACKASPSFEVLILLANCFSVPIDFLTGRINHIQPKKGATKMDNSNIVEIYESHNKTHINLYLRAGWRIIEIATSEGSNPYALYILGWNENLGETIHPELPPPPPEPTIDDDFFNNSLPF